VIPVKFATTISSQHCFLYIPTEEIKTERIRKLPKLKKQGLGIQCLYSTPKWLSCPPDCAEPSNYRKPEVSFKKSLMHPKLFPFTLCTFTYGDISNFYLNY
jgi:hypothetical protein